MNFKLLSLIKVSALVVSSVFLVGCLDEEKKLDLEDVRAEIEGLEYDKERTQKFIDSAKAKLAVLKKVESDLERAEEIGEELVGVTGNLEKVKGTVDELKASMEESVSGFEDYQAKYRAKVRKEIVGKNVDLSETKGDDYKAVRVLSVNPLEIRIYRSSGPQSVPLSEIPKEIREMLQMSEEEAESHLAKQREDAKLRAERYTEWKEGLADRQSEAAQKAIAKRLRDIQTEIETIEKNINLRLLKIQDLKSRASQWERDFSLAQSDKRREKALRYSQMYRDKAQKLTDLSSDGHLVIARLRSEEEDLKGMQTPGN
jgi:outer membrane murein-binding lipoprotein Lpp